ncbi:MAG: DUF1830 domain-containing protein [Cyanobacteria bacterium P01_G01_bin.39]
MSQILDHLPEDRKDSILCCYVNATSRIQVARITNIPNWYFERVVFPGQRLVFEAESQATLEIHSGMMASAILSDTIPCSKLSLHKVEQESVELTNNKVTSIDRAKDASQEPCELSPTANLAV